MFQNPPKDLKITKALIPSYTAAMQSMESWMAANHRQAPSDLDGLVWQIQVKTVLEPLSMSSPRASLAKDPSHELCWVTTLWAEGVLTGENLVAQGVLDPELDQRLLAFIGAHKIPMVLRPKTIVLESEQATREMLLTEIPLIIHTIQQSTNKTLKRKLVGRWIDQSREFSL
jgi:hypothetical protein